MALRILSAGVVGGLLMFVAGAVEHMMFQWCDRTMQGFQNEPALVDAMRAEKLEHGIYSFPDLPGFAKAEDRHKAYDELNSRFKKGPNGILIVGRSGEDMMTGRELGLELATNILTALLAAWVISRFAPEIGFFQRWLAVVLIGVAAWSSISASHGIWYRFHAAFVRDELYCLLFEGALAGVAIAAIVRGKPFRPAT